MGLDESAAPGPGGGGTAKLCPPLDPLNVCDCPPMTCSISWNASDVAWLGDTRLPPRALRNGEPAGDCPSAYAWGASYTGAGSGRAVGGGEA